MRTLPLRSEGGFGGSGRGRAEGVYGKSRALGRTVVSRIPNQPFLLPFTPPLRPCPARVSLSLRAVTGERGARGFPGFAAHPLRLRGGWRRPAGEAASHSNGSSVSWGTRVTAAAAAAAHSPRRGFVLHSFGLPPFPLPLPLAPLLQKVTPLRVRKPAADAGKLPFPAYGWRGWGGGKELGARRGEGRGGGGKRVAWEDGVL